MPGQSTTLEHSLGALVIDVDDEPHRGAGDDASGTRASCTGDMEGGAGLRHCRLVGDLVHQSKGAGYDASVRSLNTCQSSFTSSWSSTPSRYICGEGRTHRCRSPSRRHLWRQEGEDTPATHIPTSVTPVRPRRSLAARATIAWKASTRRSNAYRGRHERGRE